jgi:hypothetical protein
MPSPGPAQLLCSQAHVFFVHYLGLDARVQVLQTLRANCAIVRFVVVTLSRPRSELLASTQMQRKTAQGIALRAHDERVPLFAPNTPMFSSLFFSFDSISIPFHFRFPTPSYFISCVLFFVRGLLLLLLLVLDCSHFALVGVLPLLDCFHRFTCFVIFTSLLLVCS